MFHKKKRKDERTMKKSAAYEQYAFWLDETASENPKCEIRDALLMGVLTDAWNDPKIQFPEYVMLVFEHVALFHDINAIKTPHGEFLRVLIKGGQLTGKKKGLFK